VNGRLLAWPLLLVLALALAGQTIRWDDRLTANRALRGIEALTAAAVRVGRADVLRANIESLRRMEKRDPLEVGLPLARGSQHLLLRQGQAAISAYEEALKLEPRPEIYLNLGRALALEGRIEEARQNFRIAMRLSPRLAPEIPADYR
jgi:tetratricopeptide (TPR) repeat protein